MYLSPSTYQALGLSVGAGYTILGAFATLFPSTAARTFFNLGNGVALWPYNNNHASSTTPAKPAVPSTATDDAVHSLMRLLGARDLSIAAAIFALDWQQKYDAVGTVILAGMGLCLADVLAVWRRRGPAL